MACAAEVACLETGVASDFRARTPSARNDYQGSRTLGEMAVVCDLGERVRGCAEGTNFEPLISVDRAVLANPPAESEQADQQREHRQCRGRCTLNLMRRHQGKLLLASEVRDSQPFTHSHEANQHTVPLSQNSPLLRFSPGAKSPLPASLGQGTVLY